MRDALATVVRYGGLAAVLLLPLWFNPYTRVPFEPAKVTLFWTIATVMGAAWLVWRLLGLPTRQSSQASHASAGRPLPWAVSAYAAVVLLATAVSIDLRLSLWGTADNPRGATTILAGVLFFLALADVLRRPAQINRLVQVLILASVPVIVYGFAQALGLDPLPWITDSVSPVHATLGRSNFLGAYLAMVVPWTLALVTLGSRCNADVCPSDELAGSRRFGVVLLMQVTCLVLTLARGAWLGLTVGSVVFFVLLALRWRQRRLWQAAGLALVVGCGVLAAMTFVRLPAGNEQAAAAGMSYPELRTESALRRSVIWQHALALAPARWPLGYGPATFEQVFSARYPPGTLYQGTDAVVDDPHNLLLERLLATGVIGLVVYGGLMVAFAKTGLDLWQRGRGLDTAQTPIGNHPEGTRPTVSGRQGLDTAQTPTRSAVSASGRQRWSETMAAAALASVAAYLTQALFNPDVVVLSMLFWLALAVMLAVARMDTLLAHEDHRNR